MAHFQNTYGGVPQTTETDQYGNPIRPTGTGGAFRGDEKERHGVSGMLHRSGSSSSSSSDDDGFGGRRKKKGIKDKIKEKLPGQHNTDQAHAASTTAPGYAGAHENKGMMDKIKEKLPGHH